jgi:hypothetical protein
MWDDPLCPSCDAVVHNLARGELSLHEFVARFQEPGDRAAAAAAAASVDADPADRRREKRKVEKGGPSKKASKSRSRTSWTSDSKIWRAEDEATMQSREEDFLLHRSSSDQCLSEVFSIADAGVYDGEREDEEEESGAGEGGDGEEGAEDWEILRDALLTWEGQGVEDIQRNRYDDACSHAPPWRTCAGRPHSDPEHEITLSTKPVKARTQTQTHTHTHTRIHTHTHTCTSTSTSTSTSTHNEAAIETPKITPMRPRTPVGCSTPGCGWKFGS